MLRSLLSFTQHSSPNYIFPRVDPTTDGEDCLKDCSDCAVRCPSNVKIENSTPLYGHIKEFHTHVLVATGKTDWIEKAEHEKGSLMEAFNSGAGKSKQGRIMVSASNLTPPESGPGYEEDRGRTTVLLLPSFTFVDCVSQAGIRGLIDSFIDIPQSPSGTTASPKNTNLPTRPCPHEYIVLLCSHKRRDARCGITAPLIKKEMERHLRPRKLYRDLDDERHGGVGIYFVSHVGAHKFAANMLVYRKSEQQMIWLARVRPEHCEGIVKYTILQGKVVHPESQLRGGFDRLRGLTSW